MNSKSPGETSDQRDAKARTDGARGGSADQLGSAVPESETKRWKRLVEAEARDRLRRNIRQIASQVQRSRRRH